MMINPELFAAFCAAAIALVLLPGPVVTLVVANSLKHGTRTALYSVTGASTGNAILIVMAAIGISSILAVISDVFEIIRWLGAAYLVYLGVREWRDRGAVLEDGQAAPARPGKVLFWQGVLIAITNPKAILFYIAFFPQFIDPTLAAAPQLAAMTVAFIVIAFVFDSIYAVMAGRLRGYLADRRRARIRSRLTGVLLVGTGIGLALARR